MGFRFEHGEPVEAGVRRVAAERLDDGIERMTALVDGTADDPAKAVHEMRKRCKEMRGLIRLVRPELGKEYGRANRALREAAEQLSSIRDAEVVMATLGQLREAEDEQGRPVGHFEVMERAQAHQVAAARAIGSDDERLKMAHERLVEIRRRSEHWEIPDSWTALAGGLEATYRRGRRGLKRARRAPSDERVHEWRKPVKYLWYQLRLLEPIAPSVLAPMVARFDDLADALGDDHDLTVLVDRFEAEGDPADGDGIRSAIELARARQSGLRDRAFGLGARLYAEPPAAFVARLGRYWEIDRRHGRERRTGAMADLSALDRDRGSDRESLVERERKFLVAERPPLTGDGRRIRQGYLAVDGSVSARVRDLAGAGYTLTVKAGSGSTRTELVWQLDQARFDALWPLAEGRCIDKTRHLVPVGDHTAEVDEFGGALNGLWLVEVEFHSDAVMEAFEPPDWFGAEVTDDVRFTNAHLAVHGPEVVPADARHDWS